MVFLRGPLSWTTWGIAQALLSLGPFGPVVEIPRNVAWQRIQHSPIVDSQEVMRKKCRNKLTQSMFNQASHTAIY